VSNWQSWQGTHLPTFLHPELKGLRKSAGVLRKTMEKNVKKGGDGQRLFFIYPQITPIITDDNNGFNLCQSA